MVIERKWKRWVYFYIPLTVFVIGTLFPFYWMLITAIRPDSELYRSWRAVTNAPSIFVPYLVPPTLLFIPLANIIRTFQLGDTPWALILTYPTFLIDRK